MPEAIKKLLESLVPFLEKLAAMSETTVDDKAVAFLKLVLSSDLVGQWFHLKLMSANPDVSSWSAPTDVRAAAAEAGLDDTDFDDFHAGVFPLVQAVVQRSL